MKFVDDRERRTKAILVRFSEKEIDELKRLADIHTAGNVSQLIRFAVDQLNVKKTSKERKRKNADHVHTAIKR